ncbi:MAG TPA: hypothetical protein VFS47_08275 [Steroidobacteraceae bacterium]|nr:hypothetical protein [Steroidobacteraceae bacterium]
MKRFAFSSLLIMTLGTALGATLVRGDRVSAVQVRNSLHSDPSLPTPGQIAAWKATATTTDYIAPKAPL